MGTDHEGFRGEYSHESLVIGNNRNRPVTSSLTLEREDLLVHFPISPYYHPLYTGFKFPYLFPPALPHSLF